MKKITLYFFLFLGTIFSCKKELEKIQPKEENISESVYASGIIKSENQYKVFSTVSGLIAEILVKEGAIIKKGDPIIRLVNVTAQLNAENAKLSADYASTAANAEKLDQLKINIEAIKIKMDNDAILLEKQQNLWDQQIGTQNELLQKQLNYNTSKSNFQNAKLKYIEFQKQIDFLEKQSNKNLQIYKNLRNDYTIKSDIDGKVYSILMKKGELVNPSNPVALLGADSLFTIQLQVDEYDINRIKIGQRILVNMDSYKGQIFEASVNKIYPIMNEKTKSFLIEANFINKPKMLYPNLTCEANIVIVIKQKAITIPRDFLLEGDSVLVKENKKVKVKTGLKNYQKVEILEGISHQDYIYKPIE